jgi:ABC-2 type transport system ATP-binding protein
MLTLVEITKIFKTELLSQPFVALDRVSFRVPDGSMVGFLGANGAGKTTSLKIIMDFIRPDSGRINFDPSLGKENREIFRNIGFLPERPYFYPNLSGHEFLDFMGLLSEMSRPEIRRAVSRWADRFKIAHALNRPLRTYSKGMLQRIGFLATILHDPKLIILDEPLSGLDPIGRKELKDVMIELHRDKRTIFFSSHIVSDIEEICDRVIFLQEGKLVYDGTVEKLLKSSGPSFYELRVRDPKGFTSSLDLQDRTILPDGVIIFKISESQSASMLQKLLENRVELLSFDLIKPSLEEIFYHIRAGR